MKLFKTLFLLLAATVVAMPIEAKRQKKDKEPVVTTIYAFGVSQNLADSTIYITNIAPVNGATLLAHDQLKNIQYYSEQLKNYVEQTFSSEHQTAVFFYARDRKKIEKSYARAMLKMKKGNFKEPHFKYISTDDFHFKIPVLQVIED